MAADGYRASVKPRIGSVDCSRDRGRNLQGVSLFSIFYLSICEPPDVLLHRGGGARLSDSHIRLDRILLEDRVFGLLC